MKEGEPCGQEGNGEENLKFVSMGKRLVSFMVVKQERKLPIDC